jgi:hypothetical protein
MTNQSNEYLESKRRIELAASKEPSAKHRAFSRWLKENGNIDVAPRHVMLCQALLNVYRDTDEFARLFRQPAAGRTSDTPDAPNVSPK